MPDTVPGSLHNMEFEISDLGLCHVRGLKCKGFDTGPVSVDNMKFSNV